MKDLLKNWNATRLTHLVASLVFIGFAFFAFNGFTIQGATGSLFLLIIGLGFLIQSLSNTGCSKDGCDTPRPFNYRRRH